MDNQTIADAFSLLSRLMEIHGENPFKAKGYSIAAFNIERLTMPLENLPKEQIFAIKGIGDATGKKIVELIETGELKALNDILAKTPAGVLDMMHIKGLGPKKVAVVWKEMGLESLGELLYACTENRLTMYKGFGEKTQANIKESIAFFLKNQERSLFADIEPFALELQRALEERFPADRTQLTGALRRQLEIVDEVEWLTTIPQSALAEYLEGLGFTLSENQDGKLVARGGRNVPLVWYQATADQFGTRLFETSSAPEFLSAWRELYPAGEHSANEEGIFEAAGVPYIIAPMRENIAVISRAKNGMGDIIQTSDIRGIIHSHSDWSDGAHTVEKMARAAKERGMEYIVISDHSRSAGYANGLTEERLQAQHELIDELNQSLAPFKIFKSIESDILGDGRLDYSDQVLATFDLVIASVHSNLGMPQDKAMTRLITALRNPFTTILGHPTGRLLLSRKGYTVDHVALLDVCAEEGVVMELNAHPRRLDMDWRWLGDAMERGVMTSIDPDAHSVEGFDVNRYGVLVAQKAGLTRAQNLSSFSREELEKWLAARRKAKGI